MRALREKVAPRKEDEDLEKRDSEKREPDKRDSEKKEVEKKRGDSATRGDVMALEQLVESNGAPPQQV
jgi:hypothetical protein